MCRTEQYCGVRFRYRQFRAVMRWYSLAQSWQGDAMWFYVKCGWGIVQSCLVEFRQGDAQNCMVKV